MIMCFQDEHGWHVWTSGYKNHLYSTISRSLLDEWLLKYKLVYDHMTCSDSGQCHYWYRYVD